MIRHRFSIAFDYLNAAYLCWGSAVGRKEMTARRRILNAGEGKKNPENLNISSQLPFDMWLVLPRNMHVRWLGKSQFSGREF